MMIRLVQAEGKAHIDIARELFREYSSLLGIDLGFQGFDKELAELPGDYAPPDGRLILAFEDTSVAACAALRKITGDTCELKRMYVRREFRGKGIARTMGLALIEEARAIGYSRMRLDTLPFMKEAMALYRSLGFQDIAPYRYNPVEGAIFMELLLR